MTKAQIIDQLTNRLFTRIAVTPHGVGVVAIRDIAAGADPFADCKEPDAYIGLSEQELSALPAAAQALVVDFCPFQDGAYQVPGYGMAQIDMSYYLNHSTAPNMAEVERGTGFIAARDIRAGEELTVDYETYDDNGLKEDA